MLNDQTKSEAIENQELSIEDAFALALHLHRCAEYQDAETLYRRILEVDPCNADAMHFLGVLLHQRDLSDTAIGLIERSIELDPGHADRYNNLGNVFVEHGRIEDAAKTYEKAISLLPDHSDAWNNLGAVLRAQGKLEKASAAYLTAIELNPESNKAYHNYANLLGGQGKVKEAVTYYCKAVILAPNDPSSRQLLGIAYCTLGQVEAAAEVFSKWLKDEPDNPIARHMLASCSATETPKRASDEYITMTFDAFAGSFDRKLESLSYQAPQLVTNAIAAIQNPPLKNLIVLDAGCGTGLCGTLIAPFALRLTGVDLSSRMLAVAKSRHIYDELVTAELGEYLHSQSNTFDLIISADTLVYFGELVSVFASAAKALRPGGLLIFTVEELEDASNQNGFRINPHGRYSHTRKYVEETLKQAGFSTSKIDSAILRMESGNPVNGLVVTARFCNEE